MIEQLELWAGEFFGADMEVRDVTDMSGHSGKVYAFSLYGDDFPRELVVRLAPAGVAHKGATDVLRQVPLLNALHDAGVKVPAVVDASGDPRIFGVPFLIMERLPGRPLIMGPDAPPPWLGQGDRQSAHNLAAELLASIHLFDVDDQLGDWDESRSPRDEIDIWSSFLVKGKEDTWIAMGMEVRDLLCASIPENFRQGLVHGDFQTNNVLFTGRGETLRATGVVDWEVASIGPVELDLAWYLMMNDERCWHPVERRGGLDHGQIINHYQDVLGTELDNLNWFRGLACFRLAAIAALNIRLHRTGRRIDHAWERASLTMPIMFDSAKEMLAMAS